MKTGFWRSGLLFASLTLSVSLLAQPAYQSARLVQIEKRVEYIPQAWHWDTVIVSRTLVKYELQVRVDGVTYLAEYIPDIQPTGPIPAEWKDNQPVDARIDMHSLYIKLSYGPEIETHIMKRIKS